MHSRSQRLVALVFVLVATVVGTLVSSSQVIRLNQADTPNAVLSTDERAYYDYVSPRLNALVTEVDSVNTMVSEKSRNIFKLESASTRITTLSNEILKYGIDHGVPSRFTQIHQTIERATTITDESFDAAHSALATFNFAQMRELIPKFDRAAQDLRNAQASLDALAGTETSVAEPPRRHHQE